MEATDLFFMLENRIIDVSMKEQIQIKQLRAAFSVTVKNCVNDFFAVYFKRKLVVLICNQINFIFSALFSANIIITFWLRINTYAN
jgi:hypothetical protein